MESKYKITLTVERANGFSSTEVIEKSSKNGDIPVCHFFTIAYSMSRRFCSMTDISREAKASAEVIEYVKRQESKSTREGI